MSIRISPFRKGGWEVDIRVETPSGERIRERLVAPVSSKTAAQRWAEQRAAHLVFHGRIERASAEKLVPTFADFVPRFLKEYAEAERQKASGVASKESILRVHLTPRLGSKRLDSLTDEDVQKVKSELIALNPKTVNNVLSVLSKLLKVAVE
jgi:Phage integrase, N-terminal SAM-like domain